MQQGQYRQHGRKNRKDEGRRTENDGLDRTRGRQGHVRKRQNRGLPSPSVEGGGADQVASAIFSICVWISSRPFSCRSSSSEPSFLRPSLRNGLSRPPPCGS